MKKKKVKKKAINILDYFKVFSKFDIISLNYKK